MGSLPSTKHHAVLVPYPAQGHINPFMQLAKLLHSKGIHITFVNNDHNHRRLLRTKGLDFVQGLEGLRFEAVADGLPPSDRDATQDVPKLTESILNKSMNQPFSDLLQRLNSTPGSPPVTCVISDVAMFFAWDVADELGIPNVQFWTASACGLLGYLQYDELLRRAIVPFKDENFMTDGSLEALIDWIPGMPNMRLKDLPSFMRTTSPDDVLFNYLRTISAKALKSSALLLNTFDDFEHEVVEEMKKMQPNIFLGGPLNMLLRHTSKTEITSLTTSLWKEDTHCLEWLDKQEPESVVYINYGSVTIMSDHHLNEFAWGLANSKHPFLWIVRPDVVMGESGTLPKEFYDEIKDRGLITSWCPQPEVLKHPSVGVYLTHCGWNSITESLVGGVPLMCWPFFAEQQTNSRFACTVWGTGVEVNADVKREELAEQVMEMLGGRRGQELRRNAKEWRRKAEEATDIGGSAYADFDRFMKKVVQLSYQNQQSATA
ncbi:unnamed protein product [Rhodiola kirilowii]